MELYHAMAKQKEDSVWRHVTLAYQPFAANKGLIELMVEKMKEKTPDIEYKIVLVE